MFHGPVKLLAEMTNREIISPIVAFAVIGAFIIIMCIASALRDGWALWSVVWHGLGAIFVTALLVRFIPPAVAELRNRRKSAFRGQKREPSA